MSIVKKIKHNPYMQTMVIILAAGIVVYVLYPFFISEKKVQTVKMEKIVPKQIVASEQRVDKTKPSFNPDRRKEELKIEHQLSSNVGNVFIKKQYDTKNGINTTGTARNRVLVNNVQVKDGLDIKPPKDDNGLKLPEPITITEKPEKKSNTKKVILKRNEKVIIKKDNEKNIPKGTYIRTVNSKEKKAEIKLLTMLYNENNSIEPLPTTYYNEENQIVQNVNDQQNQDGKIQNIETNGGTVKIIPGSSFSGELLVNQSSLYSDDVKPIIKLTDGPLKGYILIGQTRTMSDDSGLIIHLDRLIDPNSGSEQNIDAIAVNVKDLSPKFVDEIDRKLLPRVVLATLGSLMDYYMVKDSDLYEQPNSLLSQEMQKELNRYTPEVKAHRQLVAVIFY